MGFRDRFFTPQVARAIMSPSGILLAGAGAAVGAFVTGAAPLALLLGAGAWAARVAFAIPRGGARGDVIDPFRVGEPWRRFVVDAQQAQRRFDEVVRRMRPGPLRDRLQSVGSRVGDAVGECWRIARQGDQLNAALRALDVRSIRAELEEAHRDRASVEGDPDAEEALDRTVRAVESQLETARRLSAVAEDAVDRLRLLNAQLDESVARAVEISLQSDVDVSSLGGLGAEVDHVVGELEALRSALEETAVASGTSGAGGGTAAAGTA